MLIVRLPRKDAPPVFELTRYQNFQIALATFLLAAILIFLIMPFVEWLLGEG